MTNTVIRPWEARAIRDLAATRMLVEYEKEKNKPTPPSAPTGLPPGKTLNKLVPMTDSAGLKAIFMRAGSRKPSKPAKPNPT